MAATSVSKIDIATDITFSIVDSLESFGQEDHFFRLLLDFILHSFCIVITDQVIYFIRLFDLFIDCGYRLSFVGFSAEISSVPLCPLRSVVD